jgi:hypothetical protein
MGKLQPGRTAYRRRRPLLVLPGLLLLNCGCGLLFVPYATTLPPEPVRRMSVRASQTREVLPEARVSIILYKHDNWMKPYGRWGVSDSLHYEDEELERLARYACEQWEADRREDGAFEIAPRTKCSWAQVWLPLPPVLGPVLYYTYEAEIIVSAPGYDTLWFTDGIAPPCEYRPRIQSDGPPLPDGVYIERLDGVLRVYLPHEISTGVRAAR